VLSLLITVALRSTPPPRDIPRHAPRPETRFGSPAPRHASIQPLRALHAQASHGLAIYFVFLHDTDTGLAGNVT